MQKKHHTADKQQKKKIDKCIQHVRRDERKKRIPVPDKTMLQKKHTMAFFPCNQDVDDILPSTKASKSASGRISMRNA